MDFEPRVKLTPKEVADCIVAQIGREKGMIFYPFRIRCSSNEDGKIIFELECVPIGSKRIEHDFSFLSISQEEET